MRLASLIGSGWLRMIESLVAKWGYAAVGIGVFFEGETIVLVAGAMAHRGLLALWAVMAAAFAGSLLGDQLWFFVGRRYGKGFIDERPAMKARAGRVDALLSRFGSLYVIGFRFIYGLRTITPVLLGAIGYSTKRFAVLNTMSAAVWAAAFSLFGYGVGAGLRAVLGRAGRLEEAVIASVAVGLVAWLVTALRGRSSRRRSLHMDGGLATLDKSSS